MEREYVLVGLPLIGTAFGVFITALYGYKKAKSAGIDQITLAEIKDRAAFQERMIRRYDELEDKYKKLWLMWEEAAAENMKLQNRVAELEMILELT